MALNIQEERFSDTIGDMQPLLARHWDELALYKDAVPLSPDYARYAEMEAKNVLCVIAARDEGQLVGYAIFMVARGLHYSTTLWAQSDIFWVAPEHRRGGVGRALMQCAEERLAARGVAVVHVMTKIAHPLFALMLGTMGYQPSEMVVGKLLQAPDKE